MMDPATCWFEMNETKVNAHSHEIVNIVENNGLQDTQDPQK